MGFVCAEKSALSGLLQVNESLEEIKLPQHSLFVEPLVCDGTC